MKNINSLLFLVLLFVSCNGDDDSNNTIEDQRFKLFFEFNGTGTIVGDQSGKVIKRIFPDKESNSFDFYLNRDTDNFYFRSPSTSQDKWNFSKANANDVLNSDSFRTSTTTLPIVTFDGEFLRKAVIDKEENIHVLVRDKNQIGFDRIIYRKTVAGNVVQSVDLDATYDIDSFNLSFAFLDRNELYVIREDFEFYKMLRIDLNTGEMNYSELPLNLKIGRMVASDSDVYLISRNPDNSWYNLEGNQVLRTTTNLSRASIGYDTKDERFEYILLGDRRNEVGTIDLSTGVVEFSFVTLDAGSHDSDLFFFDR